MGMFLFCNIRKYQLLSCTDKAHHVFEELGRHADDNTGYSHGRYNKIGYHAYPSINSIATNIRHKRTYVTEALKELKEHDLIRSCGTLKENSSVILYALNISKYVRLIDYYHTVSKLGLDENDPKVQQFYASAMRSYEDDYDTFPIRTLTKMIVPRTIENWESLVDEGEEALEFYWRNYREKGLGAKVTSTESSSTTMKEHKNKALSNTDDSTSDDNDANQYFDDNYEDNEEEYPYNGEELKLIRPNITAKEMRRFKSNTHSIKGYYHYNEEKHPIRINQDTVDDDGLMKPERIHIADPQKAEKFWSSNMGQKTLKRLETINRNYRKEMHYVVYKRYHPDDVLEE